MRKMYWICLLAVLTVLFVLAAGCSDGTPAETTTTTTTSSYRSSGSYGSGSYGSGSYGSGSYSYTTRSSTKQYADDPYYAANDYNNDGRLSQDEFQGAVNDYMDDYFANKGSDPGRYGYGSAYDDRVDQAADAFGEDPDHVNDVYEALADAMR